MAKIFLSYRRDDSRKETGRIYDRLRQAFSSRDVFKDVDNIPPGMDFRGVLREATSECEVMLVVIGPTWLSIKDKHGNRRLDDREDFVRIEVETGLQRPSTRVIPLLVDGARMPTASELPDSLKGLAYNQAFTINDDPYFHRDMDALIRKVRPLVRKKQWRFSAAVAVILLIAVLGVAAALTRGIGGNPPMNATTTSMLSDNNLTATAFTGSSPITSLSTISETEQEATILAEIDAVRMTSIAEAEVSAAAEFYGLTATADAWTDTPTPDLRGTAVVRATETQAAEYVNLTATAVSWTDTPFPSPIFTPTETQRPPEEIIDGDIVIAPEEEIIIGLAAGLSGEGIAPLGIDIQRGAEIAVSQRKTITVDGLVFEIRLDIWDDLCSAEGGQAIANHFISSEDVVGVVGPMCSSACRAAAPIFDSANFTTVAPSCIASDLTTRGYTSFNRSVVSDALQSRIAADFIYSQLGIRRIATIHDGSPYDEGLVNILTARFEELGGEVVMADAVNVGDTDFRALLEAIAAEDPELIYFAGFPAEAARITQQREDTGLDDVLMMGADGIRGTEFVELSGEAAQGVWATSALPDRSQAFEDFLAVYIETYGEEPPAPYHGNAYDAVNILLDAVEATGTVDENGNLVLSRDAIREYVRSVQGYQGITGVMNAEGNGDMAVVDFGIYQVEDGAFVLKYTGRVVEGEIVISEAPLPAG